MKNLIERLMSLSHVCESLNVGDTIENGNVRIHRYETGLNVMDLTNAGKRGKIVDDFSVYMLDRIKDPEFLNLTDKFIKDLSKVDSYEKALSLVRKLKDDFDVLSSKNKIKQALDVEFTKQKGIYVSPGGQQNIIIDTHYLSGTIGHDKFSIADKTDRVNEQTIISTGSGSRVATNKLRKWYLDNQQSIATMKFRDLLNKLDKTDIKYHYYLAMD